MKEQWVHPVTQGREPGPAWVPVWRFRLTALLLLAVGVVIVIVAYHYYSGAGDSGGNIPRAMPAGVSVGLGQLSAAPLT